MKLSFHLSIHLIDTLEAVGLQHTCRLSDVSHIDHMVSIHTYILCSRRQWKNVPWMPFRVSPGCLTVSVSVMGCLTVSVSAAGCSGAEPPVEERAVDAVPAGPQVQGAAGRADFPPPAGLQGEHSRGNTKTFQSHGIRCYSLCFSSQMTTNCNFFPNRMRCLIGGR